MARGDYAKKLLAATRTNYNYEKEMASYRPSAFGAAVGYRPVTPMMFNGIAPDGCTQFSRVESHGRDERDFTFSQPATVVFRELKVAAKMGHISSCAFVSAGRAFADAPRRPVAKAQP